MDNPETLATLGTQDTVQIHVRDNQRAIKNGQYRDTGNIGYIKTQNKYTLEITKGQSRMDNPETLATLGTQDTEKILVRDNQRAIKNGQSRDTGNIGYTRHRTNTR